MACVVPALFILSYLLRLLITLHCSLNCNTCSRSPFPGSFQMVKLSKSAKDEGGGEALQLVLTILDFLPLISYINYVSQGQTGDTNSFI